MGAKQKPATEPVALLTTEEAITLLRLRETGTRLPARTLHRYRKLNRIRGLKVGYRWLWPRAELDKFIENQLASSGRHHVVE